jgi:hypothetical protein
MDQTFAAAGGCQPHSNGHCRWSRLCFSRNSLTLINDSPTPGVVMIMFVGTCAIAFGIGATLTGLAITLTERS